jgi:putative ABC transport system substrate-binding protein
MRLRVLVLTLVLLTVPLGAEAQPAGKVPRIGWLSVSPTPRDPSENVEAFRRALRELGYVEGRTISIEYRYAEGRQERLPELAAELVRLKVDVIVAVPTPAALAARTATAVTPIVMIQSADPVGLGLIASLARPGGNVTGIVTLSPELIGKRLELLKECLPGLSRVAVLARPDNRAHALLLGETEVAARALGLQLRVLDVRGPEDFDDLLLEAKKAGSGAVVELPNPMFHEHRKRIVASVLKLRLPTAFHTRDFVDAGGLMAYGANYPVLYSRAAAYVDKILKGATPADLPVERPATFELVINLKTAKALGLTIPRSVLLRADQAIQ